MSIFRKSIPLIAKNCRLSYPKCFHTANLLLASRPVGKSPSVARLVSKNSNSISKTKIRISYTDEDSLPPLYILRTAYKSGALDIEPEKALDLLREYQNRSGRSAVGWEQQLSHEYGVKPNTFTLLSLILRRCSGQGQRALARRVMMSASELGDEIATFELIKSFLRTRALDPKSHAGLLQNLGVLAKQEKNREAMVLLGQVLLSQQKESQALEWLRKATDHSADISAAEALSFESAGQALVDQGRILLGRKDREGARAAFRKASLELDEPSAYFYLSRLEEPASQNQYVYLLKAASSGIPEACHNLGALELSKINSRLPNSSVQTLADYGMAREWFQVAADDGFGLSMLNMALICKAVGKPDDGLKWIEKAETVPEVAEQARNMRNQWSSEEVMVS